MRVNLSDLVASKRLCDIWKDAITDYVKRIEQGDSIGDITVQQSRCGYYFKVVNGHHRACAYGRLGYSKVDVSVVGECNLSSPSSHEGSYFTYT